MHKIFCLEHQNIVMALNADVKSETFHIPHGLQLTLTAFHCNSYIAVIGQTLAGDFFRDLFFN